MPILRPSGARTYGATLETSSLSTCPATADAIRLRSDQRHSFRPLNHGASRCRLPAASTSAISSWPGHTAKANASDRQSRSRVIVEVLTFQSLSWPSQQLEAR